MGQGRRCVAAVLLTLFSWTATAAELPNAPSAARASAPNAPSDGTGVPGPDAAEFILKPAVPELPPHRKVFDKKFALMAGFAAGLTIADYEMTQRCLQRRTCAEADPFLPHSRAGMYATNLPLNAALFWWSYRRKEDGKRLWWLAPMMVIGSHAAGVVTNLRFVGK
ncbi:MAG: hypothetical protein ACR2IF_01305 [Terriglobales bacterium]